jgi:hypothetical protein
MVKAMQWDAVADQWPWLVVAGIVAVLLGALAAYRFYKTGPEPENEHIPVYQSQQDGWTPTGRIDFIDRRSTGDFVLQIEETRAADSLGGVEHREIRWRRATLDEAKKVIVAYHAQRNLSRAANFVVTAPNILRRDAELRAEPQEAPLVADQVISDPEV